MGMGGGVREWKLYTEKKHGKINVVARWQGKSKKRTVKDVCLGNYRIFDSQPVKLLEK